MKQNREPRCLDAWREVLAEVGLVEPPSQDEQIKAAQAAEKLGAIRSTATRGQDRNETCPELELDRAILSRLLRGKQKTLGGELIRLLSPKQFG